MKRTNVALAAGFASLTACVQVITTTVPFDANEVAYFFQQGSATISGQGFLRQNGGVVVTCAGESVSLFPAGQFAVQRMTQIYGSSDGGRNGVLTPISQENVPPEYLSTSRETSCDAEGDFEFNGVANGNYYVLTSVTWMVPGSYIPEGGSLAQLVQIKSGQDARVILN